jgi:transposase
MKRFIEGEDRKHVTLLPECLDDFIEDDNPVRIIDAFVEGLELGSLGFDGAPCLRLQGARPIIPQCC